MRHVIFPVFLADAEEARLLAELTRLGLGLGLAASLAAELAGAFRVVVASDSATVCAEARALGVEAQLLPGPQPEHAVLPRGLLAAARWAHGELGGEGQDGAAVFVDFRNPDLGRREVLDIAARLAAQPGAWVGVAEFVDHPVQASVFLNLRETELHLAVDPEASERFGLTVSRPYLVEAVAEMLPTGPGEVDCQDGSDVLLRLLPGSLTRGLEILARQEGRPLGEFLQLARDSAAAGDLVYWSDAQGRCRRVAEPGTPWPQGAMLPFTRALSAASFLALPHSDGLAVYVNDPPQGGHLLKVYALDQGKGDLAEARLAEECWCHIPEVASGASEGLGAWCGPITRLSGLDDCAALLFGLESPVVEGWAERCVPVLFEHGGWQVDAAGERINTATGLPIAGRQDFPSLFQMDASLLAVSGLELKRLPDLDLSSEAWGYPLGARSSLARALALGFGADLMGAEDVVGDSLSQEGES